MPTSMNDVCVVCGKTPRTHNALSDHTPIFRPPAEARPSWVTFEIDQAEVERRLLGQIKGWTPKTAMTPRAAQVLLYARAQAKRRNSEPTPIDLLCGLLAVPVDTVFRRVGLTVEIVKSMMGQGQPLGAPIDFDDIVNRANELATLRRGSGNYLAATDLAEALLGIQDIAQQRRKNLPEVKDFLARLGFNLNHLASMEMNDPAPDDAPPRRPAAVDAVADFEEV